MSSKCVSSAALRIPASHTPTLTLIFVGERLAVYLETNAGSCNTPRERPLCYCSIRKPASPASRISAAVFTTANPPINSVVPLKTQSHSNQHTPHMAAEDAGSAAVLQFMQTKDLAVLDSPLKFETSTDVNSYVCCINCCIGWASMGVTLLFCPVGACCPGQLYPHYALEVWISHTE